MLKIASVRQKDIFLSALPLALGVMAFFIVVGPRALNPLNIAWLGAGDRPTQYWGWLFFRDSPWTFPIGLNPGYGLELSNAILYSDSIPLLAFLLKPFSPLLSNPFQYFGMWLLICFVLQSWFSWKLVGLVSNSASIRLFGAGIFVFAPPMICRLHLHFSLAGHFLILAALHLAFNSKLEWRRLAFGVLLATAALVHAYLLAMVALIWLAELGGRTIRKSVSVRRAAIEIAGLFAVVGFTCWQAGYFSVGAGTSSGGFGFYRMNLLSVIDSSGWSYVLKDLPEAGGDYEGFNYLGLGVIFLIVLAIPVLISGRVGVIGVIGKNLHLFIVLFGFALFAVSNNVGLGLLEYNFSLPDFVSKIANIFRCSGRMFWPVFYVIVFAAISLVVRGYEKRVTTAVLGLALIIQLVDTSAGWSGLRKKLMTKPNSEWSTSLTDPFWGEAATKYKKIRYIPIGNRSHGWLTLASYAGTHGLATDAIYLARIGTSAIENAQRKASEALECGNFLQDSLYVLDDVTFRTAAMNADRNFTLLAKIDGFNVIAPGWKGCAECRRVKNEIKLSDLFPSLYVGERVGFNGSDTGVKFLGPGWSTPEEWGVWSDGTSAIVSFKSPPGQVTSIFIEANALISSSHPKQRLEVTVNGIPAASFTFTEPSVVFEVKVPEAVKQKSESEFLKLEFEFPDAARPKDIGLGNDSRELSLGLVAITVR